MAIASRIPSLNYFYYSSNIFVTVSFAAINSFHLPIFFPIFSSSHFFAFLSSYLILPHLISSDLISSHHLFFSFLLSHLILSHLILSPFCPLIRFRADSLTNRFWVENLSGCQLDSMPLKSLKCIRSECTASYHYSLLLYCPNLESTAQLSYIRMFTFDDFCQSVPADFSILFIINIFPLTS